MTSTNRGVAAALTLRELARRQDDGRPRTEAVPFDRHGLAGNLERRAVAAFVQEAALQLSASPTVTRLRFIVTRETRTDLRRATRYAMEQLERSLGELPPWIAAEHRTAFNRHVELVLPARRESQPGVVEDLRVGRPEVDLLRAAFNFDLARQEVGWRPAWSLVSVQQSHRSDILESGDEEQPYETRSKTFVSRQELAADLRQFPLQHNSDGLELEL